jgi:hypothetical protein
MYLRDTSKFCFAKRHMTWARGVGRTTDSVVLGVAPIAVRITGGTAFVVSYVLRVREMRGL